MAQHGIAWHSTALERARQRSPARQVLPWSGQGMAALSNSVLLAWGQHENTQDMCNVKVLWLEAISNGVLHCHAAKNPATNDHTCVHGYAATGSRNRDVDEVAHHKETYFAATRQAQ